MSPEQHEYITRKVFKALMKQSSATYALLRGEELVEARRFLWGHAADMVERLGMKGCRAWLWAHRPTTRERDAAGRFA